MAGFPPIACCLAEQTREQRNQLRTDENDTAAGHELLHALRLCAR